MKKTKHWTRLLSAIMALAMIVSMLPITAFAEAEDVGNAEQTYSKEYSSNDYASNDMQAISFEVNTTDANGAKLADGKGEISMVNAAGEFVDQAWTRTDRCKEWTSIVKMLKDKGLNIDSRKVSIFDLSMTDNEGNAVELAADKTNITVNAQWSGYANYKVYLYDGKTLTEETTGTHQSVDYGSSSSSLAGMYVGEDSFTMSVGYKVVFASEFTSVHEALEPGAYTVDADLTVLGKNNQVLSGIQVYLSNPDVPPTSPMKQKGYLVVKEDGTMTLSLDGFNHIFSQQTITSSSDVQVDELRYFNLRDYYIENAGSEEEKEAFKTIPEKCIDGITVTLKNYNGYYSFGDCTQFPVILFGYTDMLLDLTVDFSSAIAAYTRPENPEDEYTKTFTDSSTGVSVKVDTTEEWGSKLADASMEIKYLKKGDDGYDDARFQIERLCVRDDAKILGFTLKDKNGNELQVDGNSQATVSGMDVSGMQNPYVWQLYGDISRTKTISLETANDKASFTIRNLNTIVLVDKYVKAEDYYVYGGTLPFTWVRCESKDGTYSLTDYIVEAQTSVDAEYGQTVSAQYLGNSVYSGSMRKTSSGNGEEYYAKLSDEAVYAQRHTKVEVQLPYDKSKPYYYFVMSDGTRTYVRQLTDTTINNGSVYFDIINSIGMSDSYAAFSKDDGSLFSRDFSNTMLQALANAYDGATASSDKPVAYILNSDKLYAGQPYIRGTSVDRTYNGKSQTMQNLVYNDTAVLENAEAVDAGEYIMTAKPAEGRTWLDGTTNPIEYKWNINPANLSVYYRGEAIHEGEHPKLALEIIGWVNGENAETAKDFVSPTITLPEKLEAGQSYTLKPEGGSAANYEIRIPKTNTDGMLTVLDSTKKIIDKPTAAAEVLLADGNEVVGVAEGEGYALTGDWKATEGGKEYTATATLSEGYYWSDGTNAPTEVEWTLYKSVEKPVFAKTKLPQTGKWINIIVENGYSNSVSSNSARDWSISGSSGSNYRAAVCGDYTSRVRLKSCRAWSDKTLDDFYFDWSIIPNESGSTGDNTGDNTGGNSGSSGDSTDADVKTEKTVANIFVPGELNKQLPGVTAYLTNPDNPVGTASSNIPDGWTFKSIAPTSPMNVNNAVLKTDKNGKKTLTVQICNPVFTLQSIKGTSTNGGAKVLDVKTEKGDYAEKSSRITEVTFEILKDADSYVFENCVEYPTLLKNEWTVPLTLVVGNTEELPDVDGGKVDTGKKDDTNTDTDAENKFTDVAEGAYYKTAVDWAVKNGVTSGVSETLFAPEKTCTRAQVVTFLWRAAGSPEPTITENPFNDVKSGTYYYKAVLWAVEKGITSGTAADTFSPENTVSRGQVVTFQYRMAGAAKVDGTNTFTDVSAESYYADAVQWAVENGVTAGTSATTFSPNADCTRGQIVTFLYRQLGK